MATEMIIFTDWARLQTEESLVIVEFENWLIEICLCGEIEDQGE
jgi:hypothetical protein